MPDSSITRQCEARLGTTLRGKWTLERLLGIGGMAAVYVGQHKIGRRDAIKILHPEFARSKELCARFEQEARAVNGFSHPGAVEIRDIDVAEDGCPFLVMELLEGESLQERAARLGGLPETELLRVVDEVLDVLAAAHAQGIVHRDIKLDNVFLTNDGRVEVLDFGIARMRSSKQVLTMTGSRLGTAAYMAPEQVRGEEVDGRVDIFAVGATMFRLLAKRRIHEADGEAQLLVKMSTESAPALRSVAPEVGEHLAMVVDRALSFDRAKRYPSALAMQGDVRALREGQPPAFALGRLADEAASGAAPSAGKPGPVAGAGVAAAVFAMEPTGAASPAALAQIPDAAARAALAAESTAATASEVAPTVAKRHATVALGPSGTGASPLPAVAPGPDSITRPGETVRRADATATPPPGSLMAPMSQARPPLGAMTPPPGSLRVPGYASAPLEQAAPVSMRSPLEQAAPVSMRSPHEAVAYPSAYVTATSVAQRPSSSKLGWVLGGVLVLLVVVGGGGWFWAQKSAADAARLAANDDNESEDDEAEEADEDEATDKKKRRREGKGGAATSDSPSAEAAPPNPTASPSAAEPAASAASRPSEQAAARAPGALPTSTSPGAVAKPDLEPAPSLVSPSAPSTSGAGATKPAAQPAASATSTQVAAAPAPSPAPTTGPTTAGGTSPRPGPSAKSPGGKVKSPR
jgi:eukaryotic-like serine/threonine-protein kinase